MHWQASVFYAVIGSRLYEAAIAEEKKADSSGCELMWESVLYLQSSKGMKRDAEKAIVCLLHSDETEISRSIERRLHVQ